MKGVAAVVGAKSVVSVVVTVVVAVAIAAVVVVVVTGSDVSSATPTIVSHSLREESINRNTLPTLALVKSSRKNTKSVS